ncbi:FecCD family ABC transporter permease [Slackia heliotrinireducens]|uniref:FecCD family ABC transporter permease n=1 Tax=Slackia heliotrinireducens TaxID=84110 RepID=UPI003314D622
MKTLKTAAQESQSENTSSASESAPKTRGARVDESSASPVKKPRVGFAVKFAIGLVVMVAVVLASFMIGRYQNVDAIQAIKITLSQVFPFLPIEHDWAELDASVVLSIRWPRIIIALFVGAALSCSGAAYQGVFRNPLVSPDILGISAAAGFGAAVAIVFSNPYSPIVQISAFVCAIGGVVLAYLLARVKGSIPNVMLILAGVVVAAVFNAGISMMKYLADPEEQLPAITFWLMGSLTGIRWENLAYCVPIISVSLIVLLLFSWRLNLLTMGDDEAKSMGIKASRLKTIVIVCATAMTATAVSQAGTIGWIGLVIPHMARMIAGPDHSKLIPMSAVMGGTFLLLIDDLTRVISETALPLSIPIALIGAPFFAILLRRTKQGWVE